MKNRTRFLMMALLLSSLLLPACFGPRVNYAHKQSRASGQAATLRSDTNATRIRHVNGEMNLYGLRELFNTFPKTIVVDPGYHIFNVWYGYTSRAASTYIFGLDFKPGQEYVLKVGSHDNKGRAEVWVEENRTRKRVGKTIFSWNEPVTERTPNFAPGDIYSLRPPGKGWTVLRRDEKELRLQKDEEKMGEYYSLKVQTSAYSSAIDEIDFFEYVKRDRRHYAGVQHWTVVQEEFKPVMKGEATCVEHSFLFAERNPATIGKSVIHLEGSNFSCRHPRDKSIAVDFEFSHRYYESKDINLNNKIQTAFEGFEF